tara:strand:- start:76 stop:228 length:153 start_codon:yes stop_codon:yes gene_type:complete
MLSATLAGFLTLSLAMGWEFHAKLLFLGSFLVSFFPMFLSVLEMAFPSMF